MQWNYFIPAYCWLRFFFQFIYENYYVICTEVELMKERFAKLLLGEDMSGGSKGVCTALAISNSITNLSGVSLSCFLVFLIFKF